MEHHRLPEVQPAPTDAPAGTEIRYPVFSGNHNQRARGEEKTCRTR